MIDQPKGLDVAAIERLLTHSGVTFASIDYATDVTTAAAHKHHKVQKCTTANVQLFANIKHASPYLNAVKRDTGVDQFVVSEAYFEHTHMYSVVRHRKTGRLYLYAIFNSASSVYYIDGVAATVEQVAELLTASARATLLDRKPTYNVTNDVEHNVIVRTIALDNIVAVCANKQQLIAG